MTYRVTYGAGRASADFDNLGQAQREQRAEAHAGNHGARVEAWEPRLHVWFTEPWMGLSVDAEASCAVCGDLLQSDDARLCRFCCDQLAFDMRHDGDDYDNQMDREREEGR